ncbi:hypothetical protein KEM56_002664 [Ascosphaera pollenicola]|nr:hypothetical protein KEM56_002664 [Ascosphaera pollenicola]
MAKGETGGLLTLKDAEKAIANEGYKDDCLSCKIMGTGAFVGLGAYTYYSGMQGLKQQEAEIMRSATKYKMGSRKLGIVAISATLVGMGVYRALH